MHCVSHRILKHVQQFVTPDLKIRQGNEHDIISPIASVGISSEKSFNFTFGTVEVRAKMPRGDWISASII